MFVLERFEQDRRPTPHEVDELESALALAQKMHLSSELLEVGASLLSRSRARLVDGKLCL